MSVLVVVVIGVGVDVLVVCLRLLLLRLIRGVVIGTDRILRIHRSARSTMLLLLLLPLIDNMPIALIRAIVALRSRFSPRERV